MANALSIVIRPVGQRGIRSASNAESAVPLRMHSPGMASPQALRDATRARWFTRWSPAAARSAQRPAAREALSRHQDTDRSKVEQPRCNPPRPIVLDLHMPVIDGVEWAARNGPPPVVTVMKHPSGEASHIARSRPHVFVNAFVTGPLSAEYAGEIAKQSAADQHAAGAPAPPLNARSRNRGWKIWDRGTARFGGPPLPLSWAA